MSTQGSWNYREGAWEIRDGQIIASFAQTPWVIQPADIEYLQYQYDTMGLPPSIDVWLKARANGQVYHVGRYPANNYSFASALTAYAGRCGIRIHNSSTNQGPQVSQANQAPQVSQANQPPQVPQATQQMAAGFVNQQAYMPQQGFPAQQLRPGNRTSNKKKKPRTGLMLAGLFLIVIAIAIASTAADKSGAAPLIVLGIVLLFISSASRKRRSGNDSRTDYDNTNYGHTDRDNNGIDDRNGNDSDSGNDSGDNDSDSGSNDD